MRTTFETRPDPHHGQPARCGDPDRRIFEVKTPEGARYTRNGIFSLDSQRRLVTNLGHPVMGTKGEIKVPPGNIQINTEGAIQVDGNTIGNIKVVEFPESDMPQKYRRIVCRGKPSTSVRPRLQPGHIEESNVNSLTEMVKMIQGCGVTNRRRS